MAQASMSTDVATAAEHITRTAHLLDEINQREIRSVVQRLHPSLIRMSLQASLRSLADQFHKSFYVELHFDVSDPSKEELWQGGLPEELRLAIYRVAEEALSNVLKHAKANRVALRLDNPSADRVMMTIQDNGCGFDVKATPPGFGILSMQDYCGAVGGTLEIKSNTGEITTIVASFPIPSETEALPLSVTEVPKEAAYVLSSNGNGNGNGKKSAALRRAMYQGNEAVTTLVVADDEPEFCGLVADLLRPYKEFQIVAESHDGRTAISLVEELHPDVVLLDVEMPGLHGLEATKEIHSRFPDVKVVLMSAHHQREYIEEALPSGASDFINKAEFSVNRLRQACQRKTESKTQPVYEVALR